MNQIDPYKLIILDRDGVINQDSDAYVKTLDEWIPIPGSIKAIADLYKAGYTICIATNQSGLAREYFTLETLNEMHTELINLVEKAGGKIHSIEFCPHGPDDNCDCRKPLPGMFRKIADKFELDDLTGAYTVGDSLRDLEAGKQLNCTTILVKTGKGQRTISSGKSLPHGTLIHDDLHSFAASII
ncbi:D-glycero-beta-D-manno-heptose 1,7-bisphosphate 7-phosphatase [uncultured Neptuniibacter sp.]|uniref:D-glycero-beta-D-manno-heptose 1,7-bisphosphate 7-phosphatase n=1 Tax=uncultured Neptuniibacter sp. TaxID=502143 RepID=UPI002631A8D2|nr:D-glycero-beta-D-manno-heptose 1,7-bisphosphate 7-phosphatase [uncultured Neptuniibacter sp.]